MPDILNTEVFQDHSPPNPITSLRRIQTLYGALAEAAVQKGGDPAYSLYYTPGELAEFIASREHPDRYLVTLEIDLTDRNPSATDLSVSVDRLTSDTVSDLGYSRYPWGAGMDHSITQRGAKAGADVEKTTSYCHARLDRWPAQNQHVQAVTEVAKTHPDGWIIDTLEELGTDEQVRDLITEELRKQLTGSPRVTVTVQLRLHPNTVNTTRSGQLTDPAWFYPGHIDVLNTAMAARKDEKLSRKNLSSAADSACGPGTCMVTDESAEMVGTAEDPLAFFTLQQAENFPGLKRPNAWQSHPVTASTALLLQAGRSLLKACRTHRDGKSVYTFPYFTHITTERAELLYRGLRRLQDRDFGATTEHPMAFIERIVEEYGDPADKTDLRFYVLSRYYDGGDIHVTHNSPDVTLYWPRHLATSYLSLLQTPINPIRLPLNGADERRLLDNDLATKDVINTVINGGFAKEAVPLSASTRNMDNSDPVEWYTYQLLTGAAIPVTRLLDLFITRIATARTQQTNQSLPIPRLAIQFLQLETLATIGLLTAEAEQTALTTPPTVMHTNTIDVTHLRGPNGNISRQAVRRYRLSQFLESRESLTANPDRQGAFLIGILVGQLSNYQQSTRGMNRTLRDHHHAETMTAQKLGRLYRHLIDKAGVYASEVSWAGEILFPETIDALTETLADRVPTDWSLSRHDLQFFYALGVGYGIRAAQRTTNIIDQTDEDATHQPSISDWVQS